MKKKELQLVFIIFILTLFVFSPSLKNEFVNWDDTNVVLADTSIQRFSWGNTIDIFKNHFSGHLSRIRPLTYTLYSLEYHYFHLNPLPYHGVGLAIHLLNTFMVFWIVSHLLQNQRVAFWTACLFGIHPLHVAPVVWVSAQMHILYSFFYLGTIYGYIKWREIGKRRYLYLSFFMFLLSLLSCTAAMTAPLTLVLIDCYWSKSFRFHHIYRKWPFFFVSLLFGILTILTTKNFLRSENAFFPIANLPWLDRLHLTSLSILMYIEKSLWPVGLSCLYPIGYYLPLSNAMLSPLLVFILLFLLLFQKNSPFLKIVCFGFFLFLIALLPFYQICNASDSIIDDRYAYFAVLGIFLILASGLDRLWTLKNDILQPYFKFLMGTYFMILIILTVHRIQVWHNSANLWTDMIKKYPNIAASYNNRGEYYVRINKINAALHDLDKAIALDPNMAFAHFNKGNALLAKGSIPESIESYSKAISLQPQNTGFLNNRGNAFLLNEEYEQALKDYNASLNLNPHQIEAYLNRGMLYTVLRKDEMALKDFQKALSQDPTNGLAQSKIKEITERIK